MNLWHLLSPSFGGKITKEQKKEYAKLLYFKEGRFVYPGEVPTKGNFLKFFAARMRGKLPKELEEELEQQIIVEPEQRAPLYPLPVIPFDETSFMKGAQTKAIWLGHSSLLIRLDGISFLVDPMLSEMASPFSKIGFKRFPGPMVLTVDTTPRVDYVLLTHDHYDHLDYQTIRMIKEKVGMFLVPLGVGNHLQSWGIEKEKIREFAWHDAITAETVTITATPARHFSGRTLSNRDMTLWCSWVLSGEKERIFCNGDGSYGAHYKEIGETYGPFDLVFMECGQYRRFVSAVHMMPEQGIQAVKDLRGQCMIPIHWGVFNMSQPRWCGAVERAIPLAKESGVCIETPKLGEVIHTKDNNFVPYWWDILNS